MEECLEYRTAEISQQKAMETGADVSAMRVEMVHHVRQNKAHVEQEAQREETSLINTVNKVNKVRWGNTIGEELSFCFDVLSEHSNRQARVLDLEAAPQGVHPFARIVEAQLAEERRLPRTRGTGQDRDFAATVPLDDVVQ